MSELGQLYRDTIREHAAHPVGFKADFEPSHRHEIYNPQCGDRIDLYLRLRDELIVAIGFEGEACAICMASASLLCEKGPGQSKDDLLKLHDWLENALADEVTIQRHTGLEPLLGVKAFPVRIRCATLPWVAARKALIASPVLEAEIVPRVTDRI